MVETLHEVGDPHLFIGGKEFFWGVVDVDAVRGSQPGVEEEGDISEVALGGGLDGFDELIVSWKPDVRV